jgi:hypothetical protein
MLQRERERRRNAELARAELEARLRASMEQRDIEERRHQALLADALAREGALQRQLAATRGSAAGSGRTAASTGPSCDKENAASPDRSLERTRVSKAAGDARGAKRSAADAGGVGPALRDRGQAGLAHASPRDDARGPRRAAAASLKRAAGGRSSHAPPEGAADSPSLGARIRSWTAPRMSAQIRSLTEELAAARARIAQLEEG